MDFVVSDSYKLPMDIIIMLTGILRILLVGVVFVLNCCALFKVCFKSNLCMHNMVTTAVIMANLLYLITWPPFLIYILSNGMWTLINEQVYCLSQNYIINAMGMVFLSLLAVRIGDRVRETIFRRPALTGAQNVTLTFLMWILPQLMYDLISLTGNHRLCRSPVFHFLSEIARITPNETETTYTLGFMVCEQELTPIMISVHVWQYLLLVLPFSIIIIICMLMLLITSVSRNYGKKAILSPYTLWTPLKNDHIAYGLRFGEHMCRVQCLKRMVGIDLILFGNLTWHLIGRPVMILHSFLNQDDHYPPVFLDIGSHVMLAISCIVVPSICTRFRKLRPEIAPSFFRSSIVNDCGPSNIFIVTTKDGFGNFNSEKVRSEDDDGNIDLPKKVLL